MLDKMYELNLAYFKELSMYILAGKKKLEEVQERTAAGTAGEKAQRSGLAGGCPGGQRIWRRCANVLKRRFMIWS